LWQFVGGGGGGAFNSGLFCSSERLLLHEWNKLFLAKSLWELWEILDRLREVERDFFPYIVNPYIISLCSFLWTLVGS
jgi:hypothetical protein